MRTAAKLAPLSLASVLLFAAPAWPQTDADRLLAATLFKEGKAMLAEGKVPEACAKLQESFRLDPAGGTLLNLAVCHETQGKNATAWAEFTQALGLARRDGRDDRAQLAQEHITALEPGISKLVVVVPPAASVPGLTLLLEGAELRPPTWGTLTPLDPGEYAIEARAPKRRPWSTRVSIVKGGTTTTVTIPPLEALPEPPPAASSAPTAPASAPPPPTTPPGGAPAGWSSYRTAGVVALAMGAVGVGVGSYFGLRAFSKHGESTDLCPTRTTCTGNGASLEDQAGRAADFSTVGFAVGGTSAAVGLALLLLDPGKNRAIGFSPALSRSHAGLTVLRNF